MINKAISLAILAIYPLLGLSFAAAFFPYEWHNTMIPFWLGMIYGGTGILASIHVKALAIVAMQPISSGLILGGLSLILGIQGVYMANSLNSPAHLFFSLLITLGLIIYLAYKKVNKKTDGRDV